ncbi:hypothetical protein QJS04_geneDACA004354 [Acorus gramineus]|uniref:Small ribosomal subunit protein bS18c n=1 Tax=Acorus gramineus TaxID=55184 RepID=A0AAV9B146_ACOGR|nr:hypothetical protein QJS04_geneDACA004354 [Acorus gramineus]
MGSIQISSQSTNGGVNDNSHESTDDFERRIFNRFLNNDPNANSFYHKLDKFEKARGKTGADDSQLLDGLGDGFDTLSDGMDDKLKKAATTFVYSDEMKADDYAFRPDVNFFPGMKYSPKDLDLRNPVYRKPLRRPGFATTTAEVLKKADFRNVRFLANFITESGIIIKRRKTGISAKAQRKVAREIKTARAFGLMPFTTMGTKKFIFGKTMEDTEEDYAFDKSGPRFTGAKETPF